MKRHRSVNSWNTLDGFHGHGAMSNTGCSGTDGEHKAIDQGGIDGDGGDERETTGG